MGPQQYPYVPNQPVPGPPVFQQQPPEFNPNQVAGPGQPQTQYYQQQPGAPIQQGSHTVVYQQDPNKTSRRSSSGGGGGCLDMCCCCLAGYCACQMLSDLLCCICELLGDN